MRVVEGKERIIWLRGVTWLSLLAVPVLALAERLPVKTYTTADGLARDNVTRIVRDSKGFLWFCTTEGLSRFDGYKFTNYGIDQGLPSRYVNDLIETRRGQYWVATNDGLCRFNLEATAQPGAGSQPRFIIDYQGESTRGREITTVLEDHAGVIWCGGMPGLFRLDQVQGKWVCSRDGPGHPAPGTGFIVRWLLEDRHRVLWISASDGLYRRRPDGIVDHFTAAEGLPQYVLRDLLEDRAGRIWVATSQGVYQLVPEPAPNHTIVARVYTTADGLASNNIFSLFQAMDGRLWVGTRGGLNVSLPGGGEGGLRFRSYTKDNGVIVGGDGGRMAEDSDGNLWVGSELGGAMKITLNGFTTYDEADGLGHPRINALLLTQAGEFCVVSGLDTQTGMFINGFNGQRFEAVELTLPRGVTYWGWGWYQMMFQSRTGEWWMQMGKGVVRYPRLERLAQLTRARPWAIYSKREGVADEEPFRIFEDSRGDVWISTSSANSDVMTRWERRTGTFHRFTTQDGVPAHSGPAAFGEDAAGQIWIGFYYGGLARYAAGRLRLFTAADGLPPGLVRAIYLDRARRLWVGTGEGGAVRIDDTTAERPRFVVYNATNGLASNQATCFTEDEWGRIYIGTGRGLDRLDPATGRIKHYTMADGLARNFIQVALRDREGALWFGTFQGLSRLVPQLEGPSLPPPVMISELRVDGESRPLSALGETTISGLRLRADQNHLQIRFFGLGFGPGEVLRYQYQLEGANSDWSMAGEQREVNYANLAPGAYRFLVRAMNTDGVFSQTPATVEFKILPPVWQRWWFLTLIAALIASAVIGFDRYRVARLKELDAALTRSHKLTEQLTTKQTELHQANQVLELEAAVTRVLAESATPGEAAPRILQAICESTGWGLGVIWDVDPHAGRLRCVNVWHPRGTSALAFEALTRQHIFPPGEGLPGRVLASREPHWITDLTQEPNSPRLEAAVKEGLRSAFGFPILLGSEVIGVIEFFSRERRAPDAEQIGMMSLIGAHTGQLIERKRAEDALRRSREERLMELERVRRRIATDLHDDIGSSLTQISILSEVLRRGVGREDAPEVKPLTLIATASRELVDTMSDIVWAINPQKDHLSDLTRRMLSFASDLFIARQIAFDFRAPGEDRDIRLGASLRREVFLIFKESVNNLVRHSGCTEADIEFQIGVDALTLVTRDNGAGFDLDRHRDGHGLQSMRERAQALGGTFAVSSQPGQGTTVTLTVPLNG